MSASGIHKNKLHPDRHCDIAVESPANNDQALSHKHTSPIHSLDTSPAATKPYATTSRHPFLHGTSGSTPDPGPRFNPPHASPPCAAPTPPEVNPGTHTSRPSVCLPTSAVGAPARRHAGRVPDQPACFFFLWVFPWQFSTSCCTERFAILVRVCVWGLRADVSFACAYCSSPVLPVCVESICRLVVSARLVLGGVSRSRTAGVWWQASMGGGSLTCMMRRA